MSLVVRFPRPLQEVRFHLLLAVALLARLAPCEPDYEVAFLVDATCAWMRRFRAVGIYCALGDQCQFCQEGGVPLKDVVLGKMLA